MVQGPASIRGGQGVWTEVKHDDVGRGLCYVVLSIIRTKCKRIQLCNTNTCNMKPVMTNEQATMN